MRKILLLMMFLASTVDVGNSGARKLLKHKTNGNNFIYIVDTSHSVPYSDACNNIYIHLLGEKGYIEHFKKGNRIIRFKEKIAKLESGGDYSIVNRFGYLGKYQFSKRTLIRLGFSTKDVHRFILDGNLQEEAMDKLIVHNISVLENYGLVRFSGKKVKGVRVTLEGMLAGAHLLGPYAVSRFLKHGIISSDANGTTILDYIKEFSNV